jgi:hypothetical protein
MLMYKRELVRFGKLQVVAGLVPNAEHGELERARAAETY